MVNADTTRRLLRHAGLEQGEATRAPSVAVATGPGGDAPIEDAVADCLRALTSLNVELNGPVPSCSDRRAAEVPREVALALAAVSAMLRDCGERETDPARREAATRGAHQIEAAWTAILAGDVDDVHGRAVRPPA